MERIRSTKRILRKVVLSMKQNDGIYEDWRDVGNDLRVAINKFQTEMSWQRK